MASYVVNSISLSIHLTFSISSVSWLCTFSSVQSLFVVPSYPYIFQIVFVTHFMALAFWHWQKKILNS